MPCEELLGDDFQLFWDTADDYADPTWAIQKSIGDLGLDTAKTQVEIPKRISVKTYKNGRGDWSLSFTMNISRSNAFHRRVLAAISAPGDDPIHLAICDGDDIADPEANYWHGWWTLKGPIKASLDDGATVEIEGKCSCDIGDDDSEVPAFVQGST